MNTWHYKLWLIWYDLKNLDLRYQIIRLLVGKQPMAFNMNLPYRVIQWNLNRHTIYTTCVFKSLADED